MSDDTGKDEDAEEGEGYNEEIKVAIVSPAHTVPHPRTVVVKPLHTVVTDGAMRGSGRPEDLACEAVF